ncbi:MAG: hypothetical protein OXT09_15335 [Myxococcales bacterium]|nr:hypothetical protein [Myxococcales bacterium]
MSEELRKRIIETLAGADGAVRRAGAELVVDHVLDLRVTALVDAESLLPIFVQALDGDNVQRAIDRHLLPAIPRVRAQLDDAGEKVGDGLPEAVKERIVELSANPAGPRFRWMRGALDPAKLRDLFAPVVQEILLQFVRSVPGLGGDAGGGEPATAGKPSRGVASGLVGRLGREVSKGTGRLVSVGRSVADGLGVDLEGRLQETARDFSQGAMAGLQRGLRERMQSDQGREILSGLSRSVVDHIMATPVETILKDLDRLPLEAAIALAPDTLRHELGRELVRALLRGEIAAWLELEGARTLGELLEEAGLRAQVRTLAVERGHAAAAELFRSTAFASWLEQLLPD